MIKRKEIAISHHGGVIFINLVFAAIISCEGSQENDEPTNGIHWAAGVPVPSAEARVRAINVDKGRKRKTRPKQKSAPKQSKPASRSKPLPDARNSATGKPDPPEDPELARFGIYENTAPRAKPTDPVATRLPLQLKKGDRIALVGNTLFERAQHFGHIEAMLHIRHANHNLVVRNLAWSADTARLQPRPANFADLNQHLTHEKVDVILAAFGFNESFAGEQGIDQFRQSLSEFVNEIKTKAFNREVGPRIVLISPIANEDVEGVSAAEMNNDNIKLYAEVIKEVALQEQVGFVDVFGPTHEALRSPGSDLTINGVHLTKEGYEMFARVLFKDLFNENAPRVSDSLREAIIDKNRQYFRRYRPLNTFYYTGGRNKNSHSAGVGQVIVDFFVHGFKLSTSLLLPSDADLYASRGFVSGDAGHAPQ